MSAAVRTPLARRPVARSRARDAQAVLGLALLLIAGSALAEPGVDAPAPAPPPPAVSADADDALAASIEDVAWDPLEPMNRAFLTLNRGIDWALLDPISKAYGFLMPDPAKRAVRRAFANLDSPSVLANDLLQLELRDAGVTTLRFAINSTLGLGGLLDPMAENGYPGHASDFGQTLWRVGVGPGPYFVLPLLGPTNARDGVGSFVDGFFRPQAWLLGPAERLILSTTDGITLREESLEGIRALRDSSVDYYVALREAFLMNREGELEREAARRAARPPLCGPPTAGALDARTDVP